MRIERLSPEAIQEAAAILRESMLLTEVERGNSSAETDGLPEVLERECRLVGDVYGEPNALFLARTKDEVAGCVGVKLHSPDRAEITRLYVRPPHRGGGIAGRLLGRAEDHANSAGARELILDVLPSRAHVVAWFRRLGFVEIPPFETVPGPMVSLGKPL
jgi:ribosomal protein S18 acetylase RimI-like enzyme